ncbi:MAG: peptidylprolyl isomerase [Gammaproteobacteria bacterium]|nr:MAG: peptidylprolyl isomerase [Gammaproteobacteria bacterium]
MTQPPVGLVAALLCASATLYAAPPAHEPGKKSLTAAEVLRSSTASDWRALDPQNTLYLELPAGRVVIELAPQFAPHHVANVEALARGHYFDGLAVMRAQDNYVVQWGDPDAKKPVGAAQRTVGAEFERALRGLSITKLPDPDTYAPEVGFADGFPVAAEPVTGRAWLVHCYGMVGAGRDNDVDSGGGTELYVVIGQAPRHLDRNVTLLGRVVSGMERLSVMPRGSGALGFYERPGERTPIRSLRLAAEVPAAERSDLEVLRTDTPTFLAYAEARRSRHEEWFKVPAGRIDVCNVPIPTRPRANGAEK